MANLSAKIDLSQTFQSFEVSKYSDYFMLKFSDQSLFAQVNEMASGGLSTLCDIQSVEIRAFAITERINHVFQHAKRPGEAKLQVDLNIYGLAEDAELVGQKLSGAKLYLQDPDQGLSNIEYNNPHVIHFPGIEEPVVESATSDFLTGIPKTLGADKKERKALAETINQIYQSLTRSRHLERMHISPKIVTPLLLYVITPRHEPHVLRPIDQTVYGS